MKFKTQWTHTPAELTEDQKKILDKEIEYISEELDEACDLIFHTVILTNERNGPIIIVDAEDNNTDTLFLTYYETAGWISINEMED
jgi:hypothetical protein